VAANTLSPNRLITSISPRPKLDMQGIGSGFGARIDRIDKISAIDGVLGRALAHRGPSFLIVDREP
jgi:benzoylformate decarboxylase